MSALNRGAYKTAKQAGSMIPAPKVGGELTLRLPKKKSRRKPTGARSHFLGQLLGRELSPGEGANIDRRLVPYHGKSMRIQSHIEFIYIYIFICINGLLMRGIGKFGHGK